MNSTQYIAKLFVKVLGVYRYSSVEEVTKRSQGPVNLGLKER